MVQTKWCVITGAPCSGKTSVVRELHRRGHQVVNEVARLFINKELDKGRSLKEIKANVLFFERAILYLKLDIEKTLPVNKRIFFDRAVPDSIAYFIIEGLDPLEPLKRSRELKYQNIFLFDRLQLEHDRVRAENDAKAAEIDFLLENAYHRLGYNVVRIPIMPVNQRTDYLLRYL